MEKYAELKDLVMSMEEDFSKFYEKDNQSAGTRARKILKDIKDLAQEMRKEIQEVKNSRKASA